jgi:DNA-binding response OmpR family regulator
MHVLLVEDHEDSRVVLSRLLQHCGHEVAMAESVATACELLQNTRFDALISDLGLPDGDGLELVGKARELQAIPTAIALTARISDEDRAVARQAGFDHFLTKPFDFQKLRSLLAEAEIPQGMS